MQAAGVRFSGNAIVPPEGTREEGTFWSLGPVLYFAGEEGSSGLVEKHSYTSDGNSMELSSGGSFPDEPARLIPSSPETAILIQQTLRSDSGGVGILPLDPTMGKASVLEVGEPTILEELQKGGIWIYPILFFLPAFLSSLPFSNPYRFLPSNPLEVRLHWPDISRVHLNDYAKLLKDIAVINQKYSRRFYTKSLSTVRNASKKAFLLSR